MAALPPRDVMKWPDGPYYDEIRCHFCSNAGRNYWNFHGRPMCPRCNDQFVDKVKLILQFQ